MGRFLKSCDGRSSLEWRLFDKTKGFQRLSEVDQSCPTLWDPVDCSLPGSSVHRILQARILEWVTTSFCRGSYQHRGWTPISRVAGRRFNLWIAAAAAKSLQSCPILCDPKDSSPAGSPVPGILQARTLEWVAISFSNAWKWKVKVKLLSRARLLATPWTAAHQAPPSMGFSRPEDWSGCHCLLRTSEWVRVKCSVTTVWTSPMFRFHCSMKGS